MKAAVCATYALLVFAGAVSAQSVISAKAGLVNYTEGKVLLDNKEVQLKTGNFPQMKENSELRTEDGRAEVLLAPGVFLRVGENTAIKLASDRLTDTRVELLSGTAIVECSELFKDDAVTLTYKDARIGLVKNGLYRLDSEPAQLRVYDGEAHVQQAGQTQDVRKGKLLPLNGVSVAEKFDTKTGDALYRWARRRGEWLAMANPSASKYVRDRGMFLNGSSWIFNPFFGMYTYVPMHGVYNSYWGYRFWSPRQVYMVYNPPPVMGSGGGIPGTSHGGYSTVPQTSAGTSGVVASAAPTAAPSAASAPVARESGQAGSRSR